MIDDAALLRRYAQDRDEEAFAELVRRHLPFVYATALRLVGGDAHLAQDVAQTVFTDLARKAAALAGRPVLTSWLYTSTRYAAAKAVRAARRRQTREEEAQLMQELTRDTVTDSDWQRLRPAIDEALQALNERDREAVLLRFFENQPFPEVGRRLAVSDDAARLRVERALGKMRGVLMRHGVSSTTAALAVALANQPAVALPAGLAASVTGAALAGVASAGSAVAAMSLLNFMSTTKFVAGTASLVALLAVGTAIYEARVARATAEIAAALRVENEAIRTRVSAMEMSVRQMEEGLAAAQREKAESRAEAAQTDRPSPRVAQAEQSPTASADNPAALESAKGMLAHIGNLGHNPKVQDVGVDAATVAIVRSWLKQDPKAAIQWLGSVPAEGNQQLHTIEAFVAIEAEADPEIAFMLVNSIGSETSRMNRFTDVLRAWARVDPAAAANAVPTADVSEENRAHLREFVEREARPRK